MITTDEAVKKRGSENEDANQYRKQIHDILHKNDHPSYCFPNYNELRVDSNRIRLFGE